MLNRSATFTLVLLSSLVGAYPVAGNAAEYESESARPARQIAQRADPDDDGFQGAEQDLPEPLPEEPAPVLPVPAQPEPATPSPEPADSPTFFVRQIEVIGNTVLPEAEIEQIIQPLEGREVSLEELQAATDRITRLYLSAGYITSSAVLAEQDIVDGVVTIQAVEGQLAEIQIEGLRHLNPDYIRDRLRLGSQAPLRADRLEEQLRLLRNSDLLEDLQGQLRPGNQPGTTDLAVTVDEKTPLILSTGINNYSSVSRGAERTSTRLGFRNVTGAGDRLTVDFDRTLERGLTQWDVVYQLPVNAMDGALRLGATIDRGKVVNGSSLERAAEFESESEDYELSFRQPLIRSLREDLALSVGFDYRDTRRYSRGEQIGSDRTRTFRFGQDYSRRDLRGAWSLRSQFSLGTGLFDATRRAEDPDGQFFSWLGQVQRVQRLGDRHLLIANAELQLTPDELLGSEQFSIGGGRSLRGYRQNARSGDNGFRLSLENRIDVGSSVQLAPFVEMGSVWHTSNSNQRRLPDQTQTFLASVGLGFLWEIAPDLNLRLDYGFPIVDLDDRGNNIQDDGLYFSVRYNPF